MDPEDHPPSDGEDSSEELSNEEGNVPEDVLDFFADEGVLPDEDPEYYMLDDPEFEDVEFHGADPDAWGEFDDDEEWEFGGDEFDEFDSEAESDTSSVEPEEERLACEKMEQTTGGAYFLRPRLFSRVPTIGGVAGGGGLHFQVADNLAAARHPDPADTSILVAVSDPLGVSLYQIPCAGEIASASDSLQADAIDVPRRLGGFQTLGQENFSMAMSRDARFIAVGSEHGLLQIMAVDAAAQRPPHLPPDVVLDQSASTYFYTPLGCPDGPVLVQSIPAPDDTGPWETAHTASHKNFLRAATLQGLDRLLAPQAPEPDAAAEAFHASINLQEVEHNVRQVYSAFCMALGEDTGHPTAAVGAGGSADDGGPEASPAEPERGAVVLAGVMGLGLADQDAAANFALEPESMVNGVRFGMVAGEERLLAAEQSGWVYVFDLAPEDIDYVWINSYMMCSDLGEPAPSWSMRPVQRFPPRLSELGVTLPRRAHTDATAAIGPFGAPCNLAVPSPDGRWIAVCFDTQFIALLDQADRFSRRDLPFALAAEPAHELDPDVAVGAQYIAWNSTSTLLAATSDVLHAVFVWDPATGDIVSRIEGLVRPCLPLAFAPWDDAVLVVAEETKLVHVWRVSRGAPLVRNFREGGLQ